MDRYSEAMRSRLKLPNWKYVFDHGEDFAQSILIVLAEISNSDLPNFNIDIDPSTGTCVFKIGSQQFEAFSMNRRGNW